jgi:hypothetical protein
MEDFSSGSRPDATWRADARQHPQARRLGWHTLDAVKTKLR